jgi:translation initiation factor eIF-2B subunit epsilon
LDTTHSNRILLWDDRASAPRRRDAKYCSIPTIFFQENSSNITLTRDYLDVGIDVCSPDVLARFSDEFDYRELRTQFVSNCVSEEESGLQSGRIYAHVMDRGEYAGRPLGDMRRYHRVSMDLLRRWCYPLVPDNYSGPASNDDAVSYVCERHLVYRDVGGSSRRSRNRSHVGRSTQLLGTLLLGPNYSIGERCRLQRSVLGPNCTLMDDCTIVDSHLWGNVLIESGACLSGVIVCEGAVIRKGAVLEWGCVVGRGCVVGEGVRLREFTRITCAAAEVEDNDDYSGFDDSSSGEDDTSSEDSSECDGENGGEGALVDTTRSMASLKVADTNTNHDIMGKDRIGRVYVPSPPDDYDSDDDEDKARAAAMELMKSQSIGYDMTLVYRKWQKFQMEDEDDGFSLDEMGSDDDDDDMDMRDEWMNDSGDASPADGRNMHTSASTSQFGDSGVQITGRQKGVDVVKELRDICLEHETSSPVKNLRIELNSFKFSQNATYGDCCKGAMMAGMEKIVDESGDSFLTPGKLVGLLKKIMEYWGSLLQSICIGSEEGKSIRAPWSESLSLNNEVNNCPFVRVVCPPTNYHEDSI